MALSEVANALLLTYIATEYSIRSSWTRQGFSWNKFWQSFWNRIWIVLTILLQLLETNIHGLTGFLVTLVQRIRLALEYFYHIPKIIFVSILYVIVLYVDCRRFVSSSSELESSFWTIQTFLRHVAMEFVKVLPWYPCLAVVISFGFMLLLGFCETLHLPIEWLNWPIYYGTLYGPFSFIYFQVKRKAMENKHVSSLPYRYQMSS
jgi:hypothetical protein